MKKPGILLLIVLFSGHLFAKEVNHKIFIKPTYTDTTPTKSDTVYVDLNGDVKVFEKVEVEASFPGGLTAWRDFIINNLRSNVPANKGAPAGEYTVVVQFIVNKLGGITGIKAITNYGYGMEAEVIRMIKRSPRWTPAQQGGRAVNAYRQQPITFIVEDLKKKKKASN